MVNTEDMFLQMGASSLNKIGWVKNEKCMHMDKYIERI